MSQGRSPNCHSSDLDVIHIPCIIMKALAHSFISYYDVRTRKDTLGRLGAMEFPSAGKVFHTLLPGSPCWVFILFCSQGKPEHANTQREIPKAKLKSFPIQYKN